jgi:hypothetical protein
MFATFDFFISVSRIKALRLKLVVPIIHENNNGQTLKIFDYFFILLVLVGLK